LLEDIVGHCTIHHMHTALFICTANFYRSRFCEHLFNHLAQQQQLDWNATSRAVMLELGVGNLGPISPYALHGMLVRRVPLPDTFRNSMQLTEEDLQSADQIIVLDEQEHRPFMELRFPAWVDKVTYWHVGDLHAATTEEALALAERNVRALIQQLSTHIPTVAQPQSEAP